MRPIVVAVSLATFGAAGLHADVIVQGTHDRLAVRAVRTPLCDVLDRLAQHTGMTVVYGKTVPRMLVSIDMAAQSEEAVLERLLGGLGINYAVGRDTARHCVRTVILVDHGDVAAAPPAAAPAAAEVPPPVESFPETATEGKEPAPPESDEPSTAAEPPAVDMGIPWIAEPRESTTASAPGALPPAGAPPSVAAPIVTRGAVRAGAGATASAE
jgi:hypothetical protein